ncbi:flagellar biosynthesis protein FlgN [[Pantoea] beijingensis]|uniref:Flagellar biosynthesis protein FlgN n=1 Tax=[Pantoea] beijingensis TaxID=1324864 RepID=A0A443ICL1_9GAMM|nr:flagellar export chaperone FlgN [[Pantoea] beijingensis]RWR01932.1 flagellar biosynthesis protein FlgN [[Pantoea] beijingensis]
MNRLLAVLDQMQDVLSSLSDVMTAEQEQLSASQANPPLLQRITEDKSSLLNTLNYVDNMRREAENAASLHAPYVSEVELAQRWQNIQSQTRALHDINMHNGLLLNQQMSHNQQALALLKPHQSRAFYGPDGQTLGEAVISRKL